MNKELWTHIEIYWQIHLGQEYKNNKFIQQQIRTLTNACCAFILKWFEHKEVEEISRIMALSKGVIYYHINKCERDLENDFFPAHRFIQYFDKLYTRHKRHERIINSEARNIRSIGA